MLTIVLPLVTTPYLSRVLGAGPIGIYGYTLSIVTYFILFGSLGIAMYGQREIAYVQDKKEEQSKNFWEIVIFRIITMTIALIVFYFIFCLKGEYSLYYKILMDCCILFGIMRLDIGLDAAGFCKVNALRREILLCRNVYRTAV